MREPNNLLRSFRVLRGFSQHDLGAAINKSATWISFLERGQVPMTSQDRQALARVLKVSPAMILTAQRAEGKPKPK